jgi:hypothetical protein
MVERREVPLRLSVERLGASHTWTLCILGTRTDIEVSAITSLEAMERAVTALAGRIASMGPLCTCAQGGGSHGEKVDSTRPAVPQ